MKHVDISGFFNETYAQALPKNIKDLTDTQISFIKSQVLSKYDFPPKILDFCCGFGRHLSELHKQGYNVTGLEISKSFIDILNRVGLNVQSCDAREFCAPEQYDVIINMETSFGYYDDRTNEAILQNIYKALKLNGMLLLHILNREHAILNVKSSYWYECENGSFVLEKKKIDLTTGIMQINQFRFMKSDPLSDIFVKIDNSINVRIYTLVELMSMLSRVGFTINRCYGDFDGNSFRKESRDLIILCTKL